MFRNSIPPVRPYNPPTFEDIFETDHNFEKDPFSAKKPQRISLNLSQKFKQNQEQKNIFEFSNDFSMPNEMDRNSDSSEATKYFSALTRLRKKQHQMLFGDQGKGQKVKEKVKKYGTSETTSESEETKLKQQKKEEEALEKQRKKSEYIKALQAKMKIKKLNSYKQSNAIEGKKTSSMKKNLKKTQGSDFPQHNYQTNFQYEEKERRKVTRKKANVKSNQSKQKVQKNYVSKKEKEKGSDNFQQRIDSEEIKTTEKSTTRYIQETTTALPTTTMIQTTPKKAIKIRQEDIILTDFLHGDEIENEIENDIVNDVHTNDKDTEFSESVCARLRVPCRFVTEHPCCLLPQEIGLVARARAMDGSADLRWRFMESSADRRSDGPQGRMISGFGTSSSRGRTSSFSVKPVRNGIRYNHSVSKNGVLVPRYHYDGGPQLTKSILHQCWRLSYLDCRKEQDHPCCALKTSKRADHLANSAIDKWLQ